MRPPAPACGPTHTFMWIAFVPSPTPPVRGARVSPQTLFTPSTSRRVPRKVNGKWQRIRGFSILLPPAPRGVGSHNNTEGVRPIYRAILSVLHPTVFMIASKAVSSNDCVGNPRLERNASGVVGGQVRRPQMRHEAHLSSLFAVGHHRSTPPCTIRCDDQKQVGCGKVPPDPFRCLNV